MLEQKVGHAVPVQVARPDQKRAFKRRFNSALKFAHDPWGASVDGHGEGVMGGFLGGIDGPQKIRVDGKDHLDAKPHLVEEIGLLRLRAGECGYGDTAGLERAVAQQAEGVGAV